jgi:hypothetical protein
MMLDEVLRDYVHYNPRCLEFTQRGAPVHCHDGSRRVMTVQYSITKCLAACRMGLSWIRGAIDVLLTNRISRGRQELTRKCGKAVCKRILI